MRRTLTSLSSIAVLVLSAAGCSGAASGAGGTGGSGASGGSGGSSGSGGNGGSYEPAPYADLEFSFKTLETSAANQAGFQSKLLRAGDGTLYDVYFKYAGASDATCDIAVFGGAHAPSVNYTLRVGRLAPGGTTWDLGTVPIPGPPLAPGGPPSNYATGLFGIDATFDGTGQVVISVAAGQAGLASCGSSDLELATLTGTDLDNDWAIVSPADASAACCNDCMDIACQAGTDVGAWSTIATDDQGNLGIAFVDYHNLWDEDGQSHQGYEFWQQASGGVTGIRPWSGQGNIGDLLWAPGGWVVAFASFQSEGLWVVKQTANTGAWITDWAPNALRTDDFEQGLIRPSIKTSERLSLALAPDGTVGLAYYLAKDEFGNAADDLIYCESDDDGATWPQSGCQIPMFELMSWHHGDFPSLAYDAESRPLISFHVCGAQDGCSATYNHLRLAWRELDKRTWVTKEVHNVSSTTSGIYSSLVVDPVTHEVAIAFQELGGGVGAAMVARGTYP